jgi:hypothetical protein
VACDTLARIGALWYWMDLIAGDHIFGLGNNWRSVQCPFGVLASAQFNKQLTSL